MLTIDSTWRENGQFGKHIPRKWWYLGETFQIESKIVLFVTKKHIKFWEILLAFQANIFSSSEYRDDHNSPLRKHNTVSFSALLFQMSLQPSMPTLLPNFDCYFLCLFLFAT